MKKSRRQPARPKPAPDRSGRTGSPARRRVRNDNTFESLKDRFAEIADLNGASAVLGWDQATYMPRGGSDVRGRQLATLSRLAHERLIDAETGRLIDRLEASADRLDDVQSAFVAVARRDFDRASRVPPDLVAEIAAHANRAYGAWVKARPANDFDAMRSLVADGVRLSRAYSACFKPKKHILDPLIDASDPGFEVARLERLFGDLQIQLAPMVKAARSKAPADASCLHQTFPKPKQSAFITRIAERVGYDLSRGRIDTSPHPFSITIGLGDVRITTRYAEDDFTEAFYSTLHEAGHALYEQGLDPAFDRTPLAGGVSAGVHESQSRLWENIVGRGEAFLGFLYPLLQKEAAGFRRVPFAAFERAVNRVTPSLVRTDADELTYNLHVVVRFDLERRLIEGSLDPDDLPSAWNEAYEKALGVVPSSVSDGCLQDVHWYSGLIGGAFQGYAIGNILAAQFYEAAVRAHPGIPADLGKGRFSALHNWLATNVHRHGRRYMPDELIRRATGSGLTIGPYVDYLRSKYTALGVL
ncbi:MAG TPA: carboxypeptidase M32 [Hyphomicrobiaceae bacterium]|nr:carboxypeptidase M32 [Hyphomicrobiaceae bacterium]